MLNKCLLKRKIPSEFDLKSYKSTLCVSLVKVKESILLTVKTN
jgi:hypothetical protein